MPRPTKPVRHEVLVHSYSKPNRKYDVKVYTDDTFWCTCPHYTFRHASLPGGCKHIKHVLLGLEAKKADPALTTYDAAFKRDRLIATFRPIEVGEVKETERKTSNRRRGRARKLEL